jgi:hypothetical protein
MAAAASEPPPCSSNRIIAVTLLPPAAIRALSVLAIGGALAIAHAGFASAAPAKPGRVTPAATADVAVTGSLGSGEGLGENCWIEVVQERTAAGRTVTRRVHECD